MKNTTINNNPMLPLNLTRFGFDVSNPKDEKIDIESLTEIRDFIRTNFEQSKTIVRRDNKSSDVLKSLSQICLSVEFNEGDFIAAMILEGFKYKKSGGRIFFNISRATINNLPHLMGGKATSSGRKSRPKKNELTLEEWKEIANKIYEMGEKFHELFKLMKDKFKNDYKNKLGVVGRSNDKLIDYLDKIVRSKSLNLTEDEVTNISLQLKSNYWRLI